MKTNNFDMIETGKRISEYRRKNDMTQLELADKLSISYQAVSNWERGESMPDISKLPELAEIFNVSIDDILGNAYKAKIIDMIVSGNISEISQDERINVNDLINVAPILKPAQINEVFKQYKNSFTINELCGIAPFISREVLDALAKKVCDVDGIGELCGIAPFISREVLDDLAKKVCDVDGIGELCGIAPFISREVLDDLAKKVCDVDGIGNLAEIAPFISKSILNELILKNANIADEP